MAEGVPAMVCSGTVARSGPTARPAPSSPCHSSSNTYVHAKGSLNPGFSLRSRGPAEASSPRNWLQMQIPRPHPRPAESETLRVGLETRVVRGPPAASGARLSLRSSALHMDSPLCAVGGQLSLGQLHITEVNNSGFTLRGTQLGAQGPGPPLSNGLSPQASHFPP